MTETTTPTDEVVDQSSSDIRDESVLDDNNEQDSAVEQNEDTDSGESQDDSDSDDSSSADDSSQDEDKGLAKFAKSQGIDDLSDLSDREKKLLKVARDNQRSARQKLEDKANQKKVDDEVQELYKPDENDGTDDVVLKRLASIEARDTTRTFWDANPDDRKYETKMAELLLAEKETYGVDAARLLSQNLPRLLREAKAASGDYSSDAARDAGRREERERLRKSQEGGADGAHATQSSGSKNSKLTRESIDAMSYEEYDKRRDEIDKAIQRGDLY